MQATLSLTGVQIICRNNTAVLWPYAICMQCELLFRLHMTLYALQTSASNSQPEYVLGLFCDLYRVYLFCSTNATARRLYSTRTYFDSSVIFKRTTGTSVLNAYKLLLSLPVSLFGCGENFSNPGF